jgi:hypothetical protein
MLLTIFAILVVLWILGLIVNIGAWIHILLIAAIIVLIYHLVTGRRVV